MRSNSTPRRSSPVRVPARRRLASLALLAGMIAAGGLTGRTESASTPGRQTFKVPQGRAENVRFERSAGDVVTVFYDLVSDDPRAVFKVTLEALPPGAEAMVARSVTGDVGSNVKPGSGKKIVWEAGRDVESLELDRFRFKVLAEGGAGKEVPATRRTGALNVSTDPPGATVLVDGTTRGKTPMTVSDLPTGRHRLQLLLAGYLENAQNVDVEPGEGQPVTVKLTRLESPPAAERHGSALKWILPVAGGGAAAVAVLAARGGGSGGGTPQPPQPQLCSAGFTVTPSGANVAGLAAATNFLFAATGACDSFRWNFGDGTSFGQGANTSHTFNDAGQFTVILSGTNQAGTATQSQTVVVKTMTGLWSGTINVSPAISFQLQLQQTGTSITGTYNDTRFGAGTVTRSGISDVRNVSLIVTQGSRSIDLTCRGSDDMNSCAGNTSNAYTATMTMVRQ